MSTGLLDGGGEARSEGEARLDGRGPEHIATVGLLMRRGRLDGMGVGV